MSLKHAILGFLSFRPLSGYDLKKAFDRSVRHFWPANQSQIYRTLAELNELGWVHPEVIPREGPLDVKLYHLTESGRQALHQWLVTPLPTQESREPFLIQVFFGSNLNDEEVLALLRQELMTAEEKLAEYEAIYEVMREQPNEQVGPRTTFFAMLTLEHGLLGAYAYRAWLQRAIERVKSGRYETATIVELQKIGR
jgi:PadR family transcriptional regulator AphA